ncbi:MAG: hypothetical protein H7Y12_07130 [Sphingobacteriaceae bacterium]|nr:hypothetical protein [Cytophagaceae bacterium]
MKQTLLSLILLSVCIRCTHDRILLPQTGVEFIAPLEKPVRLNKNGDAVTLTIKKLGGIARCPCNSICVLGEFLTAKYTLSYRGITSLEKEQAIRYESAIGVAPMDSVVELSGRTFIVRFKYATPAGCSAPTGVATLIREN